MSLNIDETERAARALLDNRIDSVRVLVQSRQKVADLRENLSDAEREDAQFYTAAQRDGWSADELKKLGITEPAKATRVRRRAAASRAPSTDAASTDGAANGGADGASDNH